MKRLVGKAGRRFVLNEYLLWTREGGPICVLTLSACSRGVNGQPPGTHSSSVSKLAHPLGFSLRRKNLRLSSPPTGVKKTLSSDS